MAQEKEKRIRDWREIAADAVKEKDVEKLLLLMAELERALDERDRILGASRGRKAA